MNLLFGVHNHQPVGNFQHVFEKANRDCYRPFIDTLYNYPQIKTTLHFSGSLIDWLLNNDLGLLEKLKEMVGRGQVEILTGGYYEPILPIIPEQDRIGQIKMLSDFIHDYFECEPEGCWVGERVWEPKLVKSLVKAGVKYVLLDDFHFRYAGIKEEELSGYFLTQEDGHALALFPISKKLRYSVPFSQPAHPVEYLKGLAAKGQNQAAVIVDDGEKFGLWPGTHKWVYGEKWLEKFLQALLKNQDRIKTETVSGYLHNHQSRGNCVLPGASYEEMMAWSGGDFKNFFVKYPEADRLHKRMLAVSERLNQAGKTNERARRFLYKSQSNCPYWHGVFGGIYLTHLRRTAFRHLIQAESFLEQKNLPGLPGEEAILSNPSLRLFISPEYGGSITELDYLPKQTNLLDTMSRREEAYHVNIRAKKRGWSFKLKNITSIHDLLSNKEEALENFLIYDSYRRFSLLEHFLPADLGLNDFKHLRYQELGDFIDGRYALKQADDAQGSSVILQRQGQINYHGEDVPLKITKQLSLDNKDTQIFIEYKLENLSNRPLDLVFGIEFNIAPEGQQGPNNLRCSNSSGEQVFSLKEDVAARGISELRLQDKVGGIECVLYFDRDAGLWSYPLETVSASEQGFERNYQQTVILPHWRIRLDKAWQTKIICNLHGITL